LAGPRVVYRNGVSCGLLANYLMEQNFSCVSAKDLGRRRKEKVSFNASIAKHITQGIEMFKFILALE
jgi:hypothetical protein